jgi:AcrR family transcriptional regulator
MGVRRRRSVTRAPGPTGVQLGELAARGMILQGAAILFAEHGVRAPSIEQILKASGVSRRTFYRLFAGKDEVLAALYELGTGHLLEACRSAVREEKETISQLERCIDAHLSNARTFGRLIYVLGGEAQGHESPLHALRMRVHETIVSLLSERMDLAAEEHVDPLLFRTLLIALEGVVRIMLEQGDEGRDVTEASIERTRSIMMRVATAAIAGTGPRVAPLPLLEPKSKR